jgi:tRNA modification GTPase
LLTDTDGLRDSEDRVETIGVERAQALMEAADVLVWLGGPNDAPDHQRLIRVHAKSDLGGKPASGTVPVSAKTGEGLKALLERIGDEAKALLPAEDAVALNRRQAGHIAEAADAMAHAACAHDLVLLAEDLRLARSAFDRLTGRAGIEDVLDALFARFCLGK